MLALSGGHRNPTTTPQRFRMSGFGEFDAPGTGNFISNTSHPVAAFFHVIFKARRRRRPPRASPHQPRKTVVCVCAQIAAVFLYLFSGWLFDNFVLTFVILVILLAADFWTVKVGGRVRAGLLRAYGCVSQRECACVEGPDVCAVYDIRVCV